MYTLDALSSLSDTDLALFLTVSALALVLVRPPTQAIDSPAASPLRPQPRPLLAAVRAPDRSQSAAPERPAAASARTPSARAIASGVSQAEKGGGERRGACTPG
ncbi:hypothetical protein NUW54_g1106 [Trametes sanguinea]|uniref:Uncharacterized protein n=1 Tax=Trametes sanguinea TaxID=158606 RepID=A0ACC1Q917_9APHY|nr:hypothetical protein NUW54_g1106 [Trametes sanguinea]